MSSDWAPVFSVIVLVMAVLSVAVLVWPLPRRLPRARAKAPQAKAPRPIEGRRYAAAILGAPVLALALTLGIAALAPDRAGVLAIAFHVFFPAWVTLTCVLPLFVVKREEPQ